MDRETIIDCVEEAMAHAAGFTPEVTAATRAVRRVRAEQLDEVFAVVDSGRFYRNGYRSATDWLATETNESIGQCKSTIHLALRIQSMPIVKESFRTGDLAEGALRLLSEAWDASIAETFARDEAMLTRWAVRLPNRDFKMVLDSWRMHADPEREERTAQERYDRRSLHLSSMLDNMGRLDGTLDPEGFALVREAIRSVSQRCEGDERTAAQRRADGLVTLAKIALEHVEPEVGKKRRKPRVIATIAYEDLAGGSRGGTLDTNHDRIVQPADATRRIACDANIHRYITDPLGTVIDHGRGRRTVSDAQFDRLVIRDHGCRVAGCSAPAAGCEAHHAKHWIDGGETNDDVVVLLCWHHHHWLHEQHWSIEPLGAGHFTLHDDRGNERMLRPPLVGLALPNDAPQQLALT
jgi:hypothetical protein